MLLGDAVAAIAAIASKRRLERLAAWPDVAGGGAGRVADLVTKCYQILHLPLESTGPKSLEYQQSLLQHRAEPAYRGRVLSIFSLLFRSGPAVGAFAIGMAAPWLGLPNLVGTAGVLAAGLMLLLSRRAGRVA